MAINKKLKKFDDNGTYRNFLTTSDFERPDASSIGTASVSTAITENTSHRYTEPYSKDNFFNNVPSLDIEYNPKCMLFVNCKYYVNPTAMTISPIIDTITNGTIGCWWRYTTASTWTKLNTTDLTFYSAYTQNKITNLTFNTVGTLRNDSNIEYMFSASTPSSNANTCENVSYKLTDNCIQLGLITLDNTSFVATGESKQIQVHTAAGNPWKITNTNSWLTFSTLTGTGPTTITVSASNNSSYTERTGNVTIEYTNMTYSSGATFTQAGMERTFDWDDATGGDLSSLIINIDWDETTISEGYTNSYTSISVNGSTSWVTERGLSNTGIGSGNFTASTQQNIYTTERNYTFNIQNNGTTVGTIKVIQAGKPAPYFYVGNTAAQATTTACTYASTVSSAAGSYTVYYKTNYTSAEIGTLTFESPSMYQSVSFATTTTAGTISVSVKENPANSPARSGDIYVKSGTTNIAKITFNQASGEIVIADYFFLGKTQAESEAHTTTAITLDTIAYNTVTTQNGGWYDTNIPLGEIIISNDNMSMFNYLPSLSSNRTPFQLKENTTYVERRNVVTITRMGTGEVLGTITIVQGPAPTPNYFYWGDGSDSATTTAVTVTSAATTTGNIPYTTNYSSTLTTATTDTWITGGTLNGTNFVGRFAANPDTTDRTGTVQIKSGDNVIATITITQKAKAYFLWSNSSTAITKSIAAATTTDSTTYTTNMTGLTLTSAASYNWITQKGITNTSGNGTFSATTQQNATTTARTGEFLVKTGSTTVATLSLQQAATGITYTITAYTGTSGTATAATVDSGGSSFTVRVQANQAWTGSSNQSWATLSQTAGTNNVNITVTVGSNAGSQRTATLTFTGEHGQTCYISITQSAYVPPVTYSIHTYTGSTGTGWEYNAGAGAGNITTVRVVTENQGWSLNTSSKPSWITVSPTAGASSTSNITVSWSANDGDARSADIYFNGSVQGNDYIRINQEASAPSYYITAYWNGSNYSYTTSTGTGSNTIDISANQSWTVDSSTKPSWLNLSQTAGTGSATITASWSNHSSTEDFDIYFNGAQTGSDHVNLKLTASTPSNNFLWDYNNSSTITPTSLDSGGTYVSNSESYSVTGYTNVGYKSSDKPSWLTISMGSGTFSYTASTQSAGASAREATITITATSYNNIGSITIKQDAGGGGGPVCSYDFYWDDNNETAITATLDSAGTGTHSYEYYTKSGYVSISAKTSTIPSWINNYNCSNIGFYFTADTQSAGASSRSDTVTIQGKKCDGDGGAWVDVGEITIEQEAGAVAKYFYWDDNNETAITVTYDWDDTSVSVDCSTNYGSLILYGTKPSWITSSGITTSRFTATLQTNGSSQRDMTIDIRTGGTSSTKVGEITIVQTQQPISYSITAYTGSSGTATATTVNSGSTSFTARVVTENQGWSVDTSSSDSWLSASPSSTGSSGTKTITISVDANDTTSDRTGYIYFDGATQGSAYIAITQRAKYVPPVTYSITAYTGSSGTATATTVNSGSTSFTARVVTENQGWSVDTSSSDSWLSASPSSTGSSGTKTITISVDANDTTNDRTGYIYFDGATQGSAYIAVTQRAKYVPPVVNSFSWRNDDDEPDSGATVDEDGGNISCYYYVTGYTGLKVRKPTSAPTATLSNADSDGTFSVTISSLSPGDTGRTYEYIIYTGYSYTTGRVGSFTVTQTAPTGRNVTFTFTNNYFENNSQNGGGALTIFSMRFQLEYDNNVVFEATYNDGDDGLVPGEGTNYPDGRWWTVQGATQNKFQIWIDYGVTQVDFSLTFDHISGRNGEGGMPITKTYTVYLTDSDTDVVASFNDVEWKNE